MKTLQQQLDSEKYYLRAYEFWHHYRPHFTQPRQSTASRSAREEIGIETARVGELITSREGEYWRVAVCVEDGQERILPWIHVSNQGRVISHVYPAATQKRLGRRWGMEYHRLFDGKLKSYGRKTQTSGQKLLIKIPHMGKLNPVWLDENQEVQSEASEQQVRDIALHTLVANTWCPIYEVDPDVNPKMLEALGWASMSREAKLWCTEFFEIDHIDQNSLNNWATNFRRTTGKENNRAALRARGGNHKNLVVVDVPTDIQDETSNTLVEWFV